MWLLRQHSSKVHQVVCKVIRDDARLFVVDYAHTPDALVQVLTTLKRHVEQQLWAVFGCGGDRDRGKRPHDPSSIKRSRCGVVDFR